MMPKSRFKHIWEGGFNDDIENSLISEEWFESCIDAHITLGFEPSGGSIVTLDPADTGDDEHGYSARHGRVFTVVDELEAENGNRATDEACGMARNLLADWFRWDCDGLGATLRDNVTRALGGSKIQPLTFKGSEAVQFPEKPFNDGDSYSIKGSPKNKDVLRNKRAQGYVMLARAMRKTHEAVQLSKKGIAPAVNIEELISFDSKGLKKRDKLKSELCRIPLKPASGLIALYSKDEMRKGIVMANGDRIVIPSPNMADSVMMSMFDFPNVKPKHSDVRPAPMAHRWK